VKDGGIASLRDLNSKHIPVLQSIVKDGSDAIENIYGVQRNQLRIFVHYHPQFYHFHVHFTRLENEIGCQVEKGHLVSDIVQNLQMNGEFYSKRTISYKLPINDRLYACMKEEQND
jgi:m7GpppX diphosphatase